MIVGKGMKMEIGGGKRWTENQEKEHREKAGLQETPAIKNHSTHAVSFTQHKPGVLRDTGRRHSIRDMKCHVSYGPGLSNALASTPSIFLGFYFPVLGCSSISPAGSVVDVFSLEAEQKPVRVSYFLMCGLLVGLEAGVMEIPPLLDGDLRLRVGWAPRRPHWEELAHILPPDPGISGHSSWHQGIAPHIHPESGAVLSIPILWMRRLRPQRVWGTSPGPTTSGCQGAGGHPPTPHSQPLCLPLPWKWRILTLK